MNDKRFEENFFFKKSGCRKFLNKILLKNHKERSMRTFIIRQKVVIIFSGREEENTTEPKNTIIRCMANILFDDILSRRNTVNN
ncbi:hypothetical protein RCL_jg14315.t1 [Rhizophagus clarus]|uniref:Uncharacterized protein n=1 Tax=Rhizophagus clarus TaxID=94130 RepID=A0A8H3QSN9_9GLOM|nr:hypothetical protein RCL_jg14315.t1 [Rhizophagus clarus]